MTTSPTYTHYQSQFFAYKLSQEALGGDGVTQSLSAARVDLNPHQVDAAMFAMRSPVSKGVLLADEVGLGKTIEAALVIAQRWWERRRRLLLITPASLRKQWAQELYEKFSLPTVILDAKRVGELRKAGETDPFKRDDGIVIMSYEYAARMADELRHIPWDLVVCDEAHKLRNVYKAKETARSAVLRSALANRQKLLLTATPLQNNLMELYGLVSLIDEQFFGSPEAFKAEFSGRSDNASLALLGRRMEPICKRTLRRQVQKAGLINYTNRHPRTFDFTPSKLEEDLYNRVSEYLAGLPDLVLLMDEAHRYRGSAGWKAINELKPIIGLEVTATPKTVGAGATAFKNVIYDYPLPAAMEDGYVKEPAVGTRANFDPKTVTPDVLERIKLEDGIHYHEHVKVQLQTYARQNGVKTVYPFMLVVASDINESERLKSFMESDQFFDGRYSGRVITVHSGHSGVESDETAAKLLAVEHSGETDIVVHVNKLKEGWDVTNLYTIVPLRASASEILTEQTLGRGLRLPYGKRTGVDAVDTLTVIAHDRFNEIIEKAQSSEVIIKKKVTIGDGGDVPTTKPVMVETKSVVEEMLYPTPTPSGVSKVEDSQKPTFTFKEAGEIELAATTLADVLPRYQNKVGALKDITKPEIVREIVEDAIAVQRSKEGLFPSLTQERAEQVITELCTVFAEKTIAVPQIVLTPVDQVSFGFSSFQLTGLEQWNYQPISTELLVQMLRTEERSIISASEGGERESRLENYIVARLIDFDEVDYDAHAELLYNLAGQVLMLSPWTVSSSR